MKKILVTFLSLATLFLVSCSSEGNPKKANFSKGEIVFELTSSDGTGAPSAELFNYMNFMIAGTDFDGKQCIGALGESNLRYVIECDDIPTVDKSYFATLKFGALVVNDITDPVLLDFKVQAYTVICDRDGNEIENTISAPYSYTCNDLMTNYELHKEFDRVLFNSEFELCYVQSSYSGEWMYKFVWGPVEE